MKRRRGRGYSEDIIFYSSSVLGQTFFPAVGKSSRADDDDGEVQDTKIEDSLPDTMLDLPALRQHPSYQSLYRVLTLLEYHPPSWSECATRQEEDHDTPVISRYLTQIIKSSLDWFTDSDDDNKRERQQEEIWDLAARRLAERCGRTGIVACLASKDVEGRILTTS